MADRSAARMWGACLEVAIKDGLSEAAVRALWEVAKGYDFTPDQAGLSDSAIARLESLGLKVYED